MTNESGGLFLVQKNKFGKAVKWILLLLLKIIVGIVALVSLLPYLIPPKELPYHRHDLAFPESEFIMVDGIEMHYRLWESSGEPVGNVLLVHGFGGSTFSWRYTAPVLQEAGYRIVAVDLPGFGLTERKTGFSHTAEARAEIVWQLLEIIEPEVRWHLIGHSMGGATVSVMALKKTEQAESMVLVAGAVNGSGRSGVNRLFKYPPVGRWVRVLSSRFLLTESNVERMLASAYGRPLTAEEVAGYYRPVAVKDSDLVLIDLFTSTGMPLGEQIANLRLPVLLLWGETDSWVPLQRGQRLLDKLPNAELVVLDSEGHCPMETAPAIFNDQLLNFLDN